MLSIYTLLHTWAQRCSGLVSVSLIDWSGGGGGWDNISFRTTPYLMKIVQMIFCYAPLKDKSTIREKKTPENEYTPPSELLQKLRPRKFTQVPCQGNGAKDDTPMSLPSPSSRPVIGWNSSSVADWLEVIVLGGSVRATFLASAFAEPGLCTSTGFLSAHTQSVQITTGRRHWRRLLNWTKRVLDYIRGCAYNAAGRL